MGEESGLSSRGSEESPQGLVFREGFGGSFLTSAEQRRGIQSGKGGCAKIAYVCKHVEYFLRKHKKYFFSH